MRFRPLHDRVVVRRISSADAGAESPDLQETLADWPLDSEQKRFILDSTAGIGSLHANALVDMLRKASRAVIECASILKGETKSGQRIIIPDTVREKPMEGEVVAVGPGLRDENGFIVTLELKAGDRVLFGKWAGTEVKLDGEELLIMKESDIMAVISESVESLRSVA